MDESTVYEAFGMLELKNRCKTYYARKKGKSHIENNIVCQDYCLVKNIDKTTQVICVADGHGGEVYVKSDIGSRLACEVFCDLVKKTKEKHKNRIVGRSWLEELKTRDFKKEFIDLWRNSVILDYKTCEEGCNEIDTNIVMKYGTTFLFAIFTENKIALGQLGDGAILLFNDYDQCQLFKRHKAKVSSHTSSIASNRAEYDFHIDTYRRDSYSYILLSTDGIYDKLDNNDSFFIYAKSLLRQLKENKAITQPFNAEDIDVSNISKDDCTIALTIFKKKSKKYDLSELEKYNFTDIKFKRSITRMDIYEATNDSKKYELHVFNRKVKEKQRILNSCSFFKAEYVLNNETVFAYLIPDEWVRISELIECGEHLEKKYWFNENESIGFDDFKNSFNEFTNEYWLDIYEKMLKVKKELRFNKINFRNYALECAFITKDRDIVFLSDIAFNTKKDYKTSESILKCFFNYFNIIGKMSYANILIPLFGTYTQGQNIAAFHLLNEKKTLCRVIYNQEKKILGLWNTSGFTWNIPNEKRAEILNQSVLRLNKNHIILINVGGDKVTNLDCIDGYAKYQIEIFEVNRK